MHLNSLTFNFSLTCSGSIENGKSWEKCVSFLIVYFSVQLFDYQPLSLSLSMLALHSICSLWLLASMYGAWIRLQIVKLRSWKLLSLTLLSYSKQGVTNTLALPINKMLYIYLLCPHSEQPKKHLFQFKQSKHIHPRNRFT